VVEFSIARAADRAVAMAKQNGLFNPRIFLTSVGPGRKMMSFEEGQLLFAKGDAADALFVIQNGTVKLSVKSPAGREATLDLLSDGDFVGKDSVAGQSSRVASATAMTDCRLLRIEKNVMLLALTQQVKFANMFLSYALARNIRYQQDLVDQHCNLSAKRLARILLRLARYDGREATDITIPRISHETLAEMVGTTRSRVCFFMNRFRESGFINYEHKGKMLRVHRTLLAFCESH
jgi:CRP/FNR family cyclic AMP-dependent transcriptional regulator